MQDNCERICFALTSNDLLYASKGCAIQTSKGKILLTSVRKTRKKGLDDYCAETQADWNDFLFDGFECARAEITRSR